MQQKGDGSRRWPTALSPRRQRSAGRGCSGALAPAVPPSAGTGGRRLLALREGGTALGPRRAGRSRARPANPNAPGVPGTGAARAPPRPGPAERSGAGQGRAGCASGGGLRHRSDREGKAPAGPGSKAQRNFGDLRYGARVSDFNSSVTGRRMLWVRFHVLKSVTLILLIFTSAIPEVLLR